MKKILALSAALALTLAGGAYAQGGGGTGGGNPACAADAAKYCADKQGPDRGACMRANMDKVSAACKAAMANGGAKAGGAPAAAAGAGK